MITVKSSKEIGSGRGREGGLATPEITVAGVAEGGPGVGGTCVQDDTTRSKKLLKR